MDRNDVRLRRAWIHMVAVLRGPRAMEYPLDLRRPKETAPLPSACIPRIRCRSRLCTNLSSSTTSTSNHPFNMADMVESTKAARTHTGTLERLLAMSTMRITIPRA